MISHPHFERPLILVLINHSSFVLFLYRYIHLFSLYIYICLYIQLSLPFSINENPFSVMPEHLKYRLLP